MTVIELIKELLHAPMDAEIEIAVKKGEFGDSDAEEDLHSVRLDPNPAMNTVYLCSRERKSDFKAL